MSSRACIPSDDGPSPRDPAAPCARCGQLGTVARLTQYSTPPVVRQFCRDCWLEIRDDIPSRPGHSSVSRAWVDLTHFLSLVAPPSHRPSTEDAAWFSELAQEIVDTAWDMDGPMPGVVQTLVERYRRPAI